MAERRLACCMATPLSAIYQHGRLINNLAPERRHGVPGAGVRMARRRYRWSFIVRRQVCGGCPATSAWSPQPRSSRSVRRPVLVLPRRWRITGAGAAV